MSTFIGREKDFNFLKTALNDAKNGKGGTVFISGEAGIGKTRLAEECLAFAQSNGFKVLKGWCMLSSLTSYLPIKEALKSGGLEHLISSEIPPKLEALFLITNSGLLISKYEREANPVDSDIFTGMLTAVTQFIDDCIKQSGRLFDGNVLRLGHGNFNISAISGRIATLASVYTGRENQFLLDDMESVLAEFELVFGDRIQNWGARLDDFSQAKNNLKMLFDSEKYEGIDWTKDDPKSKQSNIFENVTRGLVRDARIQPILLFIDDLQWADPSTLSLLHYLARNTRNSQVLILGTYRPEDIVQSWDGKTHQLTDTMQLMNREYLLKKLDLKNLKEEEVGGLIRTNLGKIKGELGFVDRIWKESQGNPLFVVELLNLMKEESVLIEKDGRWLLTKELKSIDIPSKIHDVIARRLSRLLKEQMQLLESASVIGEVFSSDILGMITELRRLELLKTLNEIEKVHRLIDSIEKKYRFSHVKIREVLYNGLSDELRREYHLLVGDTLRKVYGDKDEIISDLGYHYYEAHDAKNAVPRLMKAIELANSKYANSEAVRYSNYALELMGDEEKWRPQRIKVLEQLGDVQELVGNYEDAIKAYENVKLITNEIETKSRMYRKIGNVLINKGEYNNALAELEKGKEIIVSEKTSEFSRFLSAIGLVHERRGEYENAISYQNDALTMYLSFEGTEKDTADSYRRIGVCHLDMGDYNRALEFLEKSLKSYEKLGDQRGIGLSFGNIGIVFYDRGQYDKALEFYEKSLKTYEKLGDQRGLGMVLGNIAIIFYDRGEYDRALEFYEKSLKTYEKLGDQRGIGISFGNIGIVFYDRGEYDRALEFYEKGLKIHEKLSDQRSMTDALCGMSETLLKKGRIKDAETKAERALKLARQIGVKAIEGYSLKVLGMISCERKDWERSSEYFEDAISIRKGAGMKYEIAITYLEYGRMLKKKGDNEKAKEKLNEALRLFEDMKLTHRVKEVNKELEGV